jgi:hypothetical protein
MPAILRSVFWAAALASLVAGCATRSSVYLDSDDQQGIRKVVASHSKEIGKCYVSALDREPMLEGKLVVEWDFDSSGKVLEARVTEADKRIQAVAPCVLDRVKTWRFPPAAADSIVTVKYPFFFTENGKRTSGEDHFGATSRSKSGKN